MKWVVLASMMTLSSRDYIALSNPDQNSFLSYRSSAFVPNNTFRSAERVLD
jgi:hypothetical protein